MQYFISDEPDRSSGVSFSFRILLMLAFLSSVGAIARFAFQDERSVERIIDYQSRRVQGASGAGLTLRGATLYVHSITEHCMQRDLALWENWPQWLLGQFYSPLLRTQNPHWIVLGGRGDCSERAAVLQDLLSAQGIQSRFIGLGGHVVLEAQSQRGAWVLDPDYGVSMQTGIAQLQERSLSDLEPWLIEQGIDQAKSQQYASLLTSQEDNEVLEWNQPLSPRLKRVEHACELAIWLVPMICWLAILWSMPLFFRA